MAGGRGGQAGVESTDTSGVIPQQRRPGVRATAVNGPTAGTNGRATDTATGTATDLPTARHGNANGAVRGRLKRTWMS